MRHVSGRAVVALVFLLLATPAVAQKQTGLIKGTVRDADGVLPGATVVLNSPAMIQRDVTATTNDRGEFRFPLLDPGTYQLDASLAGFATKSVKGIRLLLGQTIDLDVMMELAGVTETITVEESPIVDTETTQLGTNFTEELLTRIPSGRTLNSVINFTPGATDGTVHGSSVRGNALQLDGVDVTDPVVGTQFVGFNFDNLEEIAVETSGPKAEYGQVSGAIVNAVTKSGGNDFSGELNFWFQNDGTTSTNGQEITSRFPDLTPNTVDRRIDGQAQLGGPISKDHVWFFTSYRHLETDENVVGFSELSNTKEKFTYVKTTWQMTPKNKLVASWNYDTRDLNNRAASSLVPPESTRYQDTDTHTFNFEFTSVLTPSTYAQVRAAIVDFNFDLIPKNDLPAHFNLDTGRQEVSDGRYDLNQRDRRQVIGSLSHFRDDLFGTHDFKFGFEFEDSKSWRDFTANQGLYYYDTGLDVSTPTYVYTIQDPASREAIRRTSFYAQDSWTIQNRVTLNLGVRVDHNSSYFPQQEAADGSTIAEIKDVASYTDVSPRVGVSFDLSGDGRSVARFAYSRLVDANIIQYFNSINPNAISGQLRAACVGPLGFLCLPGETISSEILDEFGASNTTIDPNFSSPRIDEYSVGIEHELFEGMSLAVNYIDKEERRLPEDVQTRTFLPYTAIDPGDTLVDSVTGDTVEIIPGGNVFTVWDYDSSSPSQLVITNPEQARREYRAIELIMNKRMSNNWSLLGSFVISRSAGLVGTSFNGSNSISGLFNDPNSLINAYGNLDYHRPYQLKLTGSWDLPYAFNLSWNYRWASGVPFSRTIRFTTATDAAGNVHRLASSVIIFGEKRGDRRLKPLNELDFRVSKEIPIGFGRLDLVLDLLNLFNIDTVTDVQERSVLSSDPDIPDIHFGDPIDFHDPREVRLAARFVW